ncbi:MAG: glycosyltransferase [Oscillospiraceae bacterium]|nr:glycosyltransferase [Oscillospiraceae bacterium]
MKYLFINSVAGIGSTGRIAAQQCRELMAQGHECTLAFGRDKANCDDIPTFRIGGDWDVRFHGLRNRLLDDQGFGSKTATKRFLQWVRQYDPDVIWLHNVHGYYLHIGLLFTYLKTCGKQIRWTLHDCWTFTGHCAYFDFAGCDKWKTGCGQCPQKHTYPQSLLLDNSRRNYAEKKNLFTGIPDLTLITPSKWLAELLQESYLKEYPVVVVYNTINTDIFRPTPSKFRENHGLQDSKMVLGVASIWEERKGLRDFVKLSSMLPPEYKIVLVGVTGEQRKGLPQSILALPRTNSAGELSEIYTAADVFVNPTYEDNYPTVNLEARACGTRIVCYDTGGCRETLGAGDSLIAKGAVAALCAAICQEK